MGGEERTKLSLTAFVGPRMPHLCFVDEDDDTADCNCDNMFGVRDERSEDRVPAALILREALSIRFACLVVDPAESATRHHA